MTTSYGIQYTTDQLSAEKSLRPRSAAGITLSEETGRTSRDGPVSRRPSRQEIPHQQRAIFGILMEFFVIGQRKEAFHAHKTRTTPYRPCASDEI